MEKEQSQKKCWVLRSGKTKVGKEEIYCIKNIVKFWNIDVNNTVILKLIETKTNSKYLVGYLDVMRSYVLDVLKHLKRKIIN